MIEIMGDEHFRRRWIEGEYKFEFKMITKKIFGNEVGSEKMAELFCWDEQLEQDSVVGLVGNEKFSRYIVEINQRSCFILLTKRLARAMLHVVIGNIVDIETNRRQIKELSEYHARQRIYNYYLNHISLLKFSTVENDQECNICFRSCKNFANLMCCKQINLYCTYCIGRFKKCPICKRSFEKETDLIKFSKIKCTNPFAFMRAHLSEYLRTNLRRILLA